MRELDLDTLMFFDAHRDALPIFTALEATLYEHFPEMQKRVQKTQITYYHKHVFACVSFARVKRVAVKTEVYPGRWTTHLVIGSLEELDEELLSWIEQAYVFSERK